METKDVEHVDPFLGWGYMDPDHQFVKTKSDFPPPLGDYQGPADEMYREAWVGFSGHVYMTVPWPCDKW